MDLALPVGYLPRQPGPLARFLPPFDEGVTTRILEGVGEQGDLVLDPFGASPRMLVEAAQAGRAVLVTCSNPVTRFVIQHTVNPFEIGQLQAALARLGAMAKDETRLERFLLELYKSECTRCGEAVVVDYFIWDRELGGPTHKVYTCEHCGRSSEDPATQSDWARAMEYSQRGLQHALALEQIATTGDRDRQHAEAALSVYPERAIYALITLVNKLSQLNLEEPVASAAHALLLSAFNSVDSLWGHPEGRRRPRRLVASPRFREFNVWRALEQAVDTWVFEDPDVELVEWPAEGPPQPRTVSVYPGPARDLQSSLSEMDVRLLLTIPPRPNQAFWTLSALWAAWLWGRDTAASIKVALRRRRYDWAWHASALRTVMGVMRPSLDPETPVVVYLPEAEPGFLAAVLAGFDGAGFHLKGRAHRIAENQAYLSWSIGLDEVGPGQISNAKQRLEDTTVDILKTRGEPSPFSMLHSAVWTDLATTRDLAKLWGSEEIHPITQVGDAFEAVIGNRNLFERLGRGAEPESGLYWLADPSGASQPLTDRVEALVLEALRGTDALTEIELDQAVCLGLQGLLTPDRRSVRTCLRSYAYEDLDEGVWRLREEDHLNVRAADCVEIRRLLGELGRSLGYEVEGEEPISWLDEDGDPVYTFKVLEMAALGHVHETGDESPVVFVLPGGRAELVAEKTRRDPRLREWLGRRLRVVKFRHVRRLAAETTLTRENLAERLAIDPAERHDPQLPLL